MVLNLSIVNESEDTISVAISRDASSIKNYSFKRTILLPRENTTLKVDYAWEGTDGCGVNCERKNYSGDWFEVNFKKNSVTLETDSIVPCKPCNISQVKFNVFNQDTLYVLTDTIYYRL